MIILAYVLSGFSLLMCLLFLVTPRVQLGFLAWFPLITGALSPLWAVLGVIGAVIGWFYQAIWAIPIGLIGAGIMIFYIWRCTQEHQGFEKAFSHDWSTLIHPEQAKRMLQKRWRLFLKLKTSPKPSFEQDITFWTVPDSGRQLLCDVWQPSDGNVSGLALVYLHGGSWAAFDKDFGTRPFFHHLTAQGHTVIDVAYRLIPEVDIYGMIGDVKRAVAWIKANADRYGVNPEKIVLGGGSSGAHIAMLAGYTPEHPKLNPEDLKEADLSVCGIVSFYGPTDLVIGYKRYDLKRQPPVPIGTKVDPKEAFQLLGRLDILLGGHPDEKPEMYKLASPVTHVHPGSPPTLLMQGGKDFLVPLVGTQELYTKLIESGVPAINVVLPWTEHVFDLLLPQISPPAQSALYDVDRFLAMLLNKD